METTPSFCGSASGSCLIAETNAARTADRACDHNGRRDWTDMLNELSVLLGEILDYHPTTGAGLAVQVLALVNTHDDIF